MAKDSQTFGDVQKSIPLKQAEPEINPDVPWADDALDRSKVANALTNLVSEQKDPLVISLDGDWGTGKTFLLKRWQEELRKEGFQSIYFNAWEDDFCDDPLTAIIGQLSGGDVLTNDCKEIVEKIKKSVLPLLGKSLLGVIGKTTGGDITDGILKIFTVPTLENYSSQIKSKKELKQHLQKMSEKVMAETGQPLVFIIDELDRCRPTFSIELLERVKHIFNIPGMVFVFGINQKELCYSIKSVYGEIDADVYLRRFFDMRFSLPGIDPVAFCKYLIRERYKLGVFLIQLSEAAQHNFYKKEFKIFCDDMPLFYGQLNLSLRDLDSCVMSMSFVFKNIDNMQNMYPSLIGTLIALRLTEPVLYQGFIRGERLGGEVMDYIDKKIPDNKRDENLEHTLFRIERALYATSIEAAGELSKLSQDELLTHPGYLSKRTQEDKERAKELYDSYKSRYGCAIDISHIHNLLELTKMRNQ